jgi:hypothetical protein
MRQAIEQSGTHTCSSACYHGPNLRTDLGKECGRIVCLEQAMHLVIGIERSFDGSHHGLDENNVWLHIDILVPWRLTALGE